MRIDSMIEKDKEDDAYMRERFILLQTNLKDSKVRIEMHGNTTVNGTWHTTDGGFEHLMVKDLQTPRPGTVPKAVLRMSDIISITIPNWP